MKKILFVLLFAFLCLSCSKEDKAPDSIPKSETKSEANQNSPPAVEETSLNTEALLGSWINDDFKMGFELKSGGRAASVNMETLDYNSWKLDGDKLILNSTSKGVSNPVTADEIFIIREFTPDKIIVSPSQNPETKWIYNRK